jgi:hypothetical protein
MTDAPRMPCPVTAWSPSPGSALRAFMSLCCRSHGVLLILVPLASLSLAGRARPDHPISEHSKTCAQGARMHAVYAAKTCASAQYAGPVALHSC